MKLYKKLKPLYPKVTVFAFSEAETEKAFLKHIKKSYGRRIGITVTIDCAHGGSPGSILESAIRHCRIPDYERRFILLDTDRPWSQTLRDKAKNNKIELIPATPCIEGFFLSLLELNFNPDISTPRKCKRLFEEKYLDRRNKLNYRNYEKIFPLNKLENLRKNNKILDKIIRLMTDVSN